MADLEQMVVDAWFRQWGKAASYLPPGGPLVPSLLVIRRNADQVLGLGHGAALIEGRVLEVRRTEIEAPLRGSVFTMIAGGEVLTVIDDPQTHDDLRKVWTMRYRG